MIRILLLGLFFVLLTSVSHADEEKDLKRLLSVLGSAHMGDDYAAIKKLLPEAGALKPDIGEGNTEARVESKIGDIPLKGEFNFANGKLVSHGFTSTGMSHEQAYDFLLKCVATLEALYGPSTRRIDLPNDPEGDCPSAPIINLSFNWQVDGKVMGLSMRYDKKSVEIGWGAQGAAK